MSHVQQYVSTLMGGRFHQGLDTLLGEVRRKVNHACALMTVRPDIVRLEKESKEAADSLHAFTMTAAYVERLTCLPSPPHVVSFIQQSVAALQELAVEIVLCKTAIEAGNERQRDPRTEN